MSKPGTVCEGVRFFLWAYGALFTLAEVYLVGARQWAIAFDLLALAGGFLAGALVVHSAMKPHECHKDEV